MLTLQYYVDANDRSPFAEWFDALDAAAVARMTVALVRLGEGKLGNTKGSALAFWSTELISARGTEPTLAAMAIR